MHLSGPRTQHKWRRRNIRKEHPSRMCHYSHLFLPPSGISLHSVANTRHFQITLIIHAQHAHSIGKTAEEEERRGNANIHHEIYSLIKPPPTRTFPPAEITERMPVKCHARRGIRYSYRFTLPTESNWNVFALMHNYANLLSNLSQFLVNF